MRVLRLHAGIDAGDFGFAGGDGTVFVMADGTYAKKKIVGELNSGVLAELGDDLPDKLVAVLCGSEVTSIGYTAFRDYGNL